MKKLLVFSILLLFFLSFCSQEAEDAFERISRTKKLLVGTDATYPPFESKDAKTGKLIGFDIDLMKTICEDLGVECEFTVVPFDGIVSGLKSRKYDVIISAFTITSQRAEAVDFSRPYYEAGQSIAVKLDEQKIKSIDDLIGKRVGAQLRTTGEILAKKIKDAEIISYENIGAAFIDMDNGKLDAIVNDKPTSEGIIALKGKAKIVGETLTSENYGLAVRKGENKLLDAINKSLEKLQNSGRIRQIKDKWFSSGEESGMSPVQDM
jgi:polar amino acid transport system substrate-binding protein